MRLTYHQNSRRPAYLRCAGHKERIPSPHGQAADVLGMESIDILLDADGVEDAALVDVLGEGQLHEDAMDLGVVVVSLDDLLEGYVMPWNI